MVNLMEKVFRLRSKKYQAQMIYRDGLYILPAGTKVIKPVENLSKLTNNYFERAEEIYNNETDNNKLLYQDIVVQSPSLAATIVTGRSANGQIEWIDENQFTLAEYLGTIENADKNKEEFSEFCKNTFDKLSSEPWFTEHETLREEFLNEYPLERLKNMTLEEYALGIGTSKDNFCYKMEFGKYAHLGPSIKGSSASKFGIWFTENGYRNKKGILNNKDEEWEILRSQIYNCLIDLGNMTEPFNTHERYPLLQGMSMIITKLAGIYFPNRFTGITKWDRLVDLLKAFGCIFDKTLQTEQLSFLLNKYVRENIIESSNTLPQLLSSQLWNYGLKFNVSESVEEAQRQVNYWLYSPGNNAGKWDEFYNLGIMGVGWDELEDFRKYKNRANIKEELEKGYGGIGSYRNSVLAIWQFANEIKPGDIVFVKKGTHEIIGRGVVESEYIYDNDREEFKSIRKVKWTNKGVWEHDGHAIKTLTNITDYTEFVEEIERLFGEEIEEFESNVEDYEMYSKESFLDEVYMSEEQYNNIVELLKYKKNLILQGAPGVGKTFIAKRLAYSMMGKKDVNRVMMVQFHQSYSYEDFIMGYRPTESGFKLASGPFYQFCKKAQDDLDSDYFFIIDEINRGNLSKIFGELLMLIEKEKRGQKLRLLYGNEQFSVPENVHIIGMMNTADRSLAMIDYALRRRFAFYEIEPAFESNGLKERISEASNLKFEKLIEEVKKLNEHITLDEALGSGFRIGHSYFCLEGEVTTEKLKNVVEYELIPLISEYWFDDKEKVNLWSSKLRGALND